MPVSISERILTTLQQQGKKQKDLADFLGIRAGAISDWKNKGVTPSPVLLPKIAEFLNETIDYLLTGADDKGNLSHNSIINGNKNTTLIVQNGEHHKRLLGEQESELLRIFNKLSIKRKAALLLAAYEHEDQEKNEG